MHSQPLSIAIIELADLSRSNLPAEVKCPPGTGYFEPFEVICPHPPSSSNPLLPSEGSRAKYS